MDTAEDWLRLSLSRGVGPAAQRKLLSAFGLPGNIFPAGRSTIAGVVGAETADRVLAGPDTETIDTTLQWLSGPDNHLITLADSEYPPALLETPDPPVVLYVKGDPCALNQPSLAVVGARSATPQGLENAGAFSRRLAEAGLAITSGLALGIDAAAHQGALASPSGRTLAVIGTGIDRVYPARHRELAHRIVEHGALISEFALGTPPRAQNFPRRNRIIAGLARGVLVVEAAIGSGSLITARLASEQGREVLAIPGSIHSPLARGCHRLIRDGAKLVETAEDILEELRWGDDATLCRQRFVQAAPPASMPEGAAGEVLAAMGHDPVDVDTLAERAGLTLDALYAILLPLELEGRVSRLPGGRFQRL